jgi:hypothetical protein
MSDDAQYRYHVQTWHGFVKVGTIVTALAALTLALMALFLT